MAKRKKQYRAVEPSRIAAAGAAVAARDMVKRAGRAINAGDCETAAKQMHGAYAALGTYQRTRLLSSRVGNIGALQRRVTRMEAVFIKKCVYRR